MGEERAARSHGIGARHFESTWHSIDFVPFLTELQKYLRGIPLRSNRSAVIMYSHSFSHCGWPPLALPGLSGSYLWVLFLHLPVSWKRQHTNDLKCFSYPGKKSDEALKVLYGRFTDLKICNLKVDLWSNITIMNILVPFFGHFKYEMYMNKIYFMKMSYLICKFVA